MGESPSAINFAFILNYEIARYKDTVEKYCVKYNSKLKDTSYILIILQIPSSSIVFSTSKQMEKKSLAEANRSPCKSYRKMKVKIEGATNLFDKGLEFQKIHKIFSLVLKI